MHTVGPVLVDPWYDHENITAILWAGVPGQESGNAITDILYGKVNPGGKSPFTWAAARSDYGTELMYTPNNGKYPDSSVQSCCRPEMPETRPKTTPKSPKLANMDRNMLSMMTTTC